MARKAPRKVKSIEVWAKLMPTGISIPNLTSKNRIAQEAQKIKNPEGENVLLKITFQSKSKSAEILGFYFGAVLPLWVAHNKDLLEQDSLEKDPTILKKLVMQKKITKEEIDEAHEDFMMHFRPKKAKNWITGKFEKRRGSLAEMNGLEAGEYTAQVVQYVEENTGMYLNVEAFKRERDNIDYIIQTKK